VVAILQPLAPLLLAEPVVSPVKAIVLLVSKC